MSRLLLAAMAVFVCHFAHAEEWFEEGFKYHATGEHRAMALRADTAFRPNDNGYKCSAVRGAQFKHTELFLDRKNAPKCFSNADCAVGTLGGFCSTVAHKSQLESYQLYTRSPAYVHLNKEWKDAKCFGPVGMCLPVKEAVCNNKKEGEAGTCVAKRDDKPSQPHIFMGGPAHE